MGTAPCRHPSRPRSGLEGVKETRQLDALWASYTELCGRLLELESGAAYPAGTGELHVIGRGHTRYRDSGLDGKLGTDLRIRAYGARDLRRLQARTLTDLCKCVDNLEAELKRKELQ